MSIHSAEIYHLAGRSARSVGCGWYLLGTSLASELGLLVFGDGPTVRASSLLGLRRLGISSRHSSSDDRLVDRLCLPRTGLDRPSWNSVRLAEECDLGEIDHRHHRARGA